MTKTISILFAAALALSAGSALAGSGWGQRSTCEAPRNQLETERGVCKFDRGVTAEAEAKSVQEGIDRTMAERAARGK
jgi:hypothetical protein